ncbi:MAG: hypothetical protein GY938_16605 [Ketobacter sp.]|nr:hypothetical protein [Ketobacter sp.]
MTHFELKVTPPFRNKLGQFARANDELKQEKRDMIAAQAKRMLGLARAEAPEKTGEFKRGLAIDIFATGNAVGFKLTMPQPLGTFIQKGTKPHRIPTGGSAAQISKGYPLRFFWAKMGRVVTFWSVQHPGTKPDKFMGRAYRRWLPGARLDLARIGRQFLRKLA